MRFLIMAIKTENIGWGLSFAMVCNNYYKEIGRFVNRRKASADKGLAKEKFDEECNRQMGLRKMNNRKVKDLGFYDNPVLMEKEITEHDLFLQHQTKEQFELAKKYGWKLAKQLTEQQDSFD